MSLCISIRFLTGRAHLHHWHAHHSDGKVDWPPSPWRLLRALVAAAGTGLTSLPEPLDEVISDDRAPDDALPVSRLAKLLAMLAAPPKIWLPLTSGGHTRQFLPMKNKPSGSAVFDSFATLSKDTPIVFEWPDLEISANDERFADLQALLRRLTYFGRAESWCEATAHLALPSEIQAGKSHWCCLGLEPDQKPNGQEHVEFTIERKLAPCWPLLGADADSLAMECTRLLTRIKGADLNRDSVGIESKEALGDFPLANSNQRLVIREASGKAAAQPSGGDTEASPKKGKSKPWQLVAIGPWTDEERDSVLKDASLKPPAMKAAKKAIGDVLKKRAEATTLTRNWAAELHRNGETSNGGLLLLRCLLRSSGEDIKDGMERPVGSRWLRYTVPRAIYQVPDARPRRAARPAEPRITLFRFALNTATVNRAVLPPLTDTLLVADKFRAAALAWHHHVASEFPEDQRHPRNLCGREADDSRVNGHDHAFFWPTDEDNDGFIDHVSVLCPSGFLPVEVEALRRLLRLKQRGGRPDLLVTPVFLGPLESFWPAERTATTFVSATPYFCPKHLGHGRKSGGTMRSIASEIRASLRLTRQITDDVQVARIDELVFWEGKPDGCTYPHLVVSTDFHDLRYSGARLKPVDAPLASGMVTGLKVEGGIRLVRALSFVRQRRQSLIQSSGRMFRIEFAARRPARPFSAGLAAHFGLGLFLPILELGTGQLADARSEVSVSKPANL